MNQFSIHKHFKLPGSLCRYVLLLRREFWGWGKAKSPPSPLGALGPLTTPTPLATITLTKSRQFGNCCSRLFFSRMYWGEMKSCDHRVRGSQVLQGVETETPRFHVPHSSHLQSQNYSPGGYSFRGHWRPRTTGGRQRETEDTALVSPQAQRDPVNT